jgi:hypothetical protein
MDASEDHGGYKWIGMAGSRILKSEFQDACLLQDEPVKLGLGGTFSAVLSAPCLPHDSAFPHNGDREVVGVYLHP